MPSSSTSTRAWAASPASRPARRESGTTGCWSGHAPRSSASASARSGTRPAASAVRDAPPPPAPARAGAAAVGRLGLGAARLPDSVAVLAKVAPDRPLRGAPARAARVHPGSRRAARARGAAARLRAAGLLPGRPPSDDRCAGSRGLRRPRAGATGLLRGARVARRRRSRGACARPGDDRRVRRTAGHRPLVVNAAGCGSAMKEYGDLVGNRCGPRIRRACPRRLRAARRSPAGAAGCSSSASRTTTPATCGTVRG